mgnify:FL=1
MPLSLQILPVELVYRILDYLDDEDLFLSMTNVCQRLNTILESYQRYKVNLDSFMIKI